MKVFLKHFTVLFFLTVMFSLSSCNDTDDGHFVEPITLYEKVKGNWVLSDILLIDETAKAAKIEREDISLIEQFNFESMSISFDVDSDNKPTSYKVGGTAPELFPNSGFWDMTSAFPHSSGATPLIYLYSDAAKTNLTAILSLVATPGADVKMGLTLTHSNQNIAFATYHYKLSKTMTNQPNE